MLGRDLAGAALAVRAVTAADLAARDRKMGNSHGKLREFQQAAFLAGGCVHERGDIAVHFFVGLGRLRPARPRRPSREQGR
jgi:hypothetical protein